MSDWPARLAPLVAALGILAVCCPARGQPAVWTLQGPRGQVVIFGSLHLLPRGLDWEPPALKAALAQADDLWFELPIDEATDDAARRLTAARGRLPRGRTLSALLTPIQRDRLARAAASVGMSVSELDRLRPWMADLELSQSQNAQAGALAVEGVETRIQSAAPPRAHRHALETVRRQVELLAGGDEAEQIAALDETTRELTEDPELYGRTVREWLAGDQQGLMRDGVERVRATTPDAYRRLVLDRNRRWAKILARLAGHSGVTVVVGGAGHMVGPQGVPALLRARGFRVDGP